MSASGPSIEPDNSTESGAPGSAGSAHGARRWRGLIALAVVALVYLVVNLLYAVSTERPEPPESVLLATNAGSADGRALVEIIPTGTTTSEELLKTKLTLVPPTGLLDDGALTQDVVVHLADQGVDIAFAKGARSFSKDVALQTEAAVEYYPFDRIEAEVLVHTTTRGPAGEDDVPTDLVVWGAFPGWRVATETSTASTVSSETTAALAEYAGTAAAVPIEVSRNGSTVATTALVMATLLLLAGLALGVARAVWLRRRRIEPGLAGWLAALLFASFPLRLNLPGAPPIGIWLDFLLFLWVVIALMAALAVFITAWLRFSPPPVVEAPAATPAAPPAPPPGP